MEALGLEFRDLFPARTAREHRDRADADALEREAFRRDPRGYLRARLRREIANIQEQRRRQLGYYAPLRSLEVDIARRRIARSVGIDLRDVPPAIGWPLWPRVAGDSLWIAPDPATTMPALWEHTPHDTDPLWPREYMTALAIEARRYRDADPTFSLDLVENAWATIPDALYRAALRARTTMRSLAIRRAVAA